MYGNTVVVAVTLAMGGNRFKIAYFSHSPRTAHGAPPLVRLGNRQHWKKHWRFELICLNGCRKQIANWGGHGSLVRYQRLPWKRENWKIQSMYTTQTNDVLGVCCLTTASSCTIIGAITPVILTPILIILSLTILLITHSSLGHRQHYLDPGCHWGNPCTARALRATFRLCSPQRAPRHAPWKHP